MQQPLTLYHYYRSSCSWRVRWALNLKKVPFNPIAINLLNGEQRSPSYLSKVPSGTVPAIELDGKIYSESLPIIEWLEERYNYAPYLLPQDSESRLYCRQIASIIASLIQPIQNPFLLKIFISDETERSAFAKDWIARGMCIVENHLTRNVTGSYCLGDSVSLADLCLIPQCYNAERFGVDLSDFPTAQRIYQSCLATPECAKSAPAVYQ